MDVGCGFGFHLKYFKDFMDLKVWFEDDTKVLEVVEEFQQNYSEYDLHREVRNGSARYKAIFNLFILNEARDWETFELTDPDNLDDHHIVPKSWGKKNNIGNRINTILNRTPLSSNTNRNILSDRLPNVYIMLTHVLPNNYLSITYVLHNPYIMRTPVLPNSQLIHT